MYGPSFPCDGRMVWPAPDLTLDCSMVRVFFENWQQDARFGRRPLMAGRIGDMPCLARRFTHGGLLRSILRDRYMGQPPRSVAELSMLFQLGKQGLPVPRPMFAWTEPAGLGYRQGLVTALIPDAIDLSDTEELSPARLRLLVGLLERFFDTGLYHPDLNIKNVLVASGESGEPLLFLLDFDKARLGPGPISDRLRERMYRRLFRSFDKAGRLAVWDSVNLANLPVHVGRAWAGYRKIRRIRALFWMLNRK